MPAEKRGAVQKQWELAELVSFMKTNRVTRVKLGGLEVDLAPSAFVAEIEAGTLGPATKSDPMPTEEDLRYWSSPVLEAEVTNGQA